MTGVSVKMEIPIVSVCISTRNRAGFLETSIKSAMQQSLGKIEIIVLDDCSTDNTFEMVKQFDDPRILYIRPQTRLGITPSWNRCAAISRGRFITFLNDDDALLPEMLEAECRLLDENPKLACVYCGFNLIDDSGKVIKTNIPHAESYIKNGEVEFLTHVISNYMCTQTVLIRRDVFEKLKGFDESLCSCTDLDFFFRVELNRHRIGYINKALVNFRSHKGSLTCKNIMNKSVLREYLYLVKKTFSCDEISELFNADKAAMLKRNATMGIARQLFTWSYECLRLGDLKGAAYYLRQFTPWRNADFGEWSPGAGAVLRYFMRTGKKVLKSCGSYFSKAS